MGEGLAVAFVERPVKPEGKIGLEATSVDASERAERIGENVSEGATDGDDTDEGRVSLLEYWPTIDAVRTARLNKICNIL
jgi:hypothetical protein